MGWKAAVTTSWWSGSNPTPAQQNNLARDLEARAKEREDAGDPEAAMKLLLAMHKARPTSCAVTLAHELSMRHPDTFAAKGCPVHGGKSRMPSGIPIPAATHHREDPPLALVSPLERESATASRVAVTPSHVTDITRTLMFQDGYSASQIAVVPGDLGSSRDETGLREMGQEGEMPWERGWHGPNGFKPPTSLRSPSSDHLHVAAVGSGKTAPSRSTEVLPKQWRNFTLSQLNAFDGSQRAPTKRGGATMVSKPRPIYVAIRGNVYDASAGRLLYGPGGKYSEFAGHDISRWVARGIGGVAANNIEDLDNLSLEGLEHFEVMTIDGWENTFAARGYPVVGRVVTPPTARRMSRSELRPFDGRGLGAGAIPPGYATAPIYMGVKDRVFDVSFGGSEFYTDGGAYACLAGRDASRVLAKMSMEPEDVKGVLDYTCLTDRETKNINDWVEKLGDGGKGYPVVGWIDLES